MTAWLYAAAADAMLVVGVLALLGCMFFAAFIIGRVADGCDKQVPR